jgi:hypothetical protein
MAYGPVALKSGGGSHYNPAGFSVIVTQPGYGRGQTDLSEAQTSPRSVGRPQMGVRLVNRRPQVSHRRPTATEATLRCLAKRSASTSCRKSITYHRFKTSDFIRGHISAAQRRTAVGGRDEATSCPRLHR